MSPMKNKPTTPPVPSHPSADDIREKAHEIYVLSGCLPGNDLDNWLKAEAPLLAQHDASARPFPKDRAVSRSNGRKAERKSA